jgi:glucose-6-phosphate dehydrogenase assembly protein OpcA
MTAPAARIPVSADGGSSVSVDQLFSELGRLWSQVAADIEATVGHPPVRTNVLTLIVVARGRSEARMAMATLHELAAYQPSRAILVEIIASGTQLNAHVSANCRYQEPGRATCYEVIELHAPVNLIEAVPSLLMPLELFDVPSFEWWVGPIDFSSRVFSRLSPPAERIIIDSSRWDSATDALLEFARYLRQGDMDCSTSDLTWARCTSWRELIAQSFDNPMTRALLPAVQHVEIDYDPPAEAQALLLVGWLGACLAWQPLDASRRGSTMSLSARTATNGQVSIDLNRQSSVGIGLRAVRLLASSGRHNTRVTIRRRSERLAAVSIETAGMPRQERIVADEGRPTLADLISDELLIHTRDRIFEQALQNAAEYLERLEANA